MARERLAGALDGADRDRAIGELYEVVDAEVLDSLRGEEPFSSLVFIRERLDAMMESWGGATLRVLRIPGAGSRPPLTVGLYSLTGVEGSGSLRVYAGTGARAAVAASSTHDGLLDARVWPAGPERVARVFAVWSGPPAAHGERTLHAELWEARDPDRVTRAWTTGTQWPDGLRVTDWRTQAGELVVRYEPRYPGWKPGCAEQFEHEDHYRLASAGGLALSRRQVANGWHRELGVAADRLFRRPRRGATRAPWGCSCPRRRCARGCRRASCPSRSASRRPPARAGRSRWRPPRRATAGACPGRSPGRAVRPAGGCPDAVPVLQ